MTCNLDASACNAASLAASVRADSSCAKTFASMASSTQRSSAQPSSAAAASARRSKASESSRDLRTVAIFGPGAPGSSVRLVLTEHRHRLGPGCRRMAVETLLVDVHEAIRRPADRLARFGGVGAPQREPRHLARQVEFGTALGLDDPDIALRVLDQEVGRVGREVAVRLDVVESETDREVVLRERRDAVGLVAEGCA